jgi:hypothetical protein
LSTEFPNAKYGLASLCGAFGNAGALLVEKIN